MKLQDGVYLYLYKRDKPLPIKMLGLIMLFAGFLILLESPVAGLVLLLIALLFLLYQSGVEINFREKTYRYITSFGIFDFGKWNELPTLKLISVFKLNISSSFFSRSGRSTTKSDTVVQVNLVYQDNKRIRLFETDKPKEAFSFASQVAPLLNLRVWDATEKEGKWV